MGRTTTNRPRAATAIGLESAPDRRSDDEHLGSGLRANAMDESDSIGGTSTILSIRVFHVPVRCTAEGVPEWIANLPTASKTSIQPTAKMKLTRSTKVLV